MINEVFSVSFSEVLRGVNMANNKLDIAQHVIQALHEFASIASLNKFCDVFGGAEHQGPHLWRKFTREYGHDPIRTWSYLDTDNREKFAAKIGAMAELRMLREVYDVILSTNYGHIYIISDPPSIECELPDEIASLILAHHVAGIDVQNEEYVKGVNTTLDAIVNNTNDDVEDGDSNPRYYS